MMSVRWLAVVALVGCGDGGGIPDAKQSDGPPDGGTFTLSWAVTDTSGQAITCDDIGASAVTAVLRNHAVEGGSTEVFSCSSLMGTSEKLTPGTYDISFELNGAAGLIATAPQQASVIVTSGGNVTLAPLAFSVDATGGLKLNVTANKPGGNCGAAAQGGAGITGTTIALTRSSTGACQPVTLMVAAGATRPASTYTVNCAMPVIAGCIENDQVMSVSGLRSGGYGIQIRGKVGALDCWTNNDSLPVPPLGHDLTRTLNLAFQMTTTGC